MKNLFYYRLEEAEKIKETYNSWIGKEAHIGKGLTGKLKSIIIKPKQKLNIREEKLYSVEFEFNTNRKFSAHEFLFHNGLIATPSHPLVQLKKEAEFPLEKNLGQN
jgi:hypothetical protein